MIFESFSTEDTKKIAIEMASTAKAGDVYCLIGDLGAGKTAFTKSFAYGLGLIDIVTSPTFSIVNEYSSSLNNLSPTLYHFDVYRIKDIQEMEDTGYEDYFYGNGIVIIEWADLIKDLWPPNCIVIIFSLGDKNEYHRIIEVRRHAK